jgi:hypothetical protein
MSVVELQPAAGQQGTINSYINKQVQQLRQTWVE